MKSITGYSLYFLLLLTVLFLVLYLTGGISAPVLPALEISHMQSAVSGARKSDAALYSGRDFRLCLLYYDSAMAEWKQQNEKWILRRDYSKLKTFVRIAAGYADKANFRAEEARTSLLHYVEFNILELKQRDSIFRARFKYLPLGDSVFIRHSRAHMDLLEAIELEKSGKLADAFNKLVEAENGFLFTEYETGRLLRSYFSSFATWEKWFRQTVKESRMNRSTAIVVDKVAHKCFLYRNGILIRQYDAEFSARWIGNKNHQGDNATPEGLYYITKKIDSRHTKYYKALLINYPNEKDKKRYNEAVRSGAIPGSVDIGSLIEIHGDGGKGKDWTNGCIALANPDMDHLYAMVRPGVQVTIVGSTVPLEELFND
jgi:L,D-peptidoglycan transpeptidase YkuD (ErfK/YbiS/YcfS/YnhG family)